MMSQRGRGWDERADGSERIKVGPGIAEGKAFKEDVSGVREVGSASGFYREAVSLCAEHVR
jgi:hypothetical protein